MKIVLLGNYPIYKYTSEIGVSYDSNKRVFSCNEELTEALCNINSTNNIHFITRSDILNKTTSIKKDKLTITFITTPRLLNGVTLFQNIRLMVQKILDKIKPDIVHGIGIEHIWPYIAVKSGYHNVVTIHGIPSEIIRKVKTPILTRMRYFKILERTVLKKARNIISISPYVADVLGRKTTARFFPVENAHSLIYHNLHANPGESKVILFVGDTLERKALNELLVAFSKICDLDFALDWQMHVIGPVHKGAYFDNHIQKTISNFNLQDRIIFKGFLFPDKLAKEYENAALLALCSLEETAPGCIAEAMAAGLPVVACGISGVPYMVEDGRSGFLCEPRNVEMLSDKLKILMKNLEMRNRMGARGKEIAAKRWRPDIIAEKTNGVYKAILQHL